MDVFKFEIDKVLRGELDNTLTKVLISPDEIDDLLESKGLVQEDFDSNGWSWDFWVTYKDKSDNKFILSGSGWYNRGLSFSKYED
jgi:hypothetical protein